MGESRTVTRPGFLDHEVTDQELVVECMALADGRYPGWRVQRLPDDRPGGNQASRLGVVRELWLEDEAHGGTEIVRLQRRVDQDGIVWRPVSTLLWLPGVF